MKKILVANRGEIAERLFHACRHLNIPCVAITSEADAGAKWASFADEQVALGGVTASESYLAQDKIIKIARQVGADAIHPGYGFLSENSEFAQACIDAGMTFIGPTPKAIQLMGDKAQARQLAIRAGVPVVSGSDGAGKSITALQVDAEKIGYPILIKASAGGGGKGMRVARSSDELADGIQAARSEAKSAFGNDHILLEHFFDEIHHIEVQLLGDNAGNLLHLHERECSIQRRHQKIIEETPSPLLSSTLRDRNLCFGSCVGQLSWLHECRHG